MFRVFLVRIFSYPDQKNSEYGHFSRSEAQYVKYQNGSFEVIMVLFFTKFERIYSTFI